LHPVDDILHIFRTKTNCRYDLYPDMLEGFLDNLALDHMWLINKDPVKAHHLPAIRPDDDILDPPDDFFDHWHLSSAWTRLGIPHRHIAEAEPDERLV
jgi:hypothetical protein